MTASADDRAPGERVKMTVSERSLGSLGTALRDWLAGRLDSPQDLAVSGIRTPSNGLSSTSVLFEASWLSQGTRTSAAYVARLAPEDSAVPVFPSYDLSAQFEVIGQVAQRSQVPVPKLRWNEPDGGPLGTPFFVMDQIDGRVPMDNPPYVFGGWLLEATPAERATLQQQSIAILAGLHAIPDPHRVFAVLRPAGGQDSLRAHVAGQAAYYDWALKDDGFRIPIIERGLQWLEDNWPADPGPDVLCWGDARIGNVIYQGFSPAAVLDWEMAAICPRELDLGWFVFLHRFFQDIAEFFEVEGLPDFLRRSEVQRCYQDMTGWAPRHMDFYLTYAAIRHAIVMARIKRRMIHFGEDQVPDDPDDYVLHRASLDKMLAGTYGWD